MCLCQTYYNPCSSNVYVCNAATSHRCVQVLPVFVSYRLMTPPMLASWDGWWRPTASGRWWPHPFLACGLITVHAGNRWCAPSSSTCQPIYTTPMHICPRPITSSTSSCPEPLWASEQVLLEPHMCLCFTKVSHVNLMVLLQATLLWSGPTLQELHP